jgi:hypothetical protein
VDNKPENGSSPSARPAIFYTHESVVNSISYGASVSGNVLDNQPRAVMKPEFPSIDQNKMVSPHAQEVECALILSQMINKVKEDPSQMRLAIYEFARARLQIDMSWADEAERKRLSDALEIAIQGVEGFSARQDDRERLEAQRASAQIGLDDAPAELSSMAMVEVHPINSVPRSIFAPKEGYSPPDAQPILEVRPRARLSTLASLSIGILIFGMIAGPIVYNRAGVLSPIAWMIRKPVAAPSNPSPAQLAPVAADVKTAAVVSAALPFPLPSDYGVYALNNAALSELHLLTEQVPDKRVAMSTPISQPSRTTLPDGKAKFVVFRRDLAGNAPDRIDVRVVARVMRALTFDAKGKPNFSPVSDAWNIRNLSYEFRVRPIAGNPEMLLIQAEKADFALPAGRYVLVLKNEGFDFTIAGKVTDLSQCLERTDAANGSFYSDCQKQ